MTDLEVTGLSKSFGPHTVLDGLNFTVEAGTFVSVLGPSGSGKTTLLRIIAGFERADRGTVRLGGRVVDGTSYVPPERRRVGYVPQEGSLFPHLTVEENVGFGLPRRDRRGRTVGDLLTMVGLEGLERRYPHQLSGGQQQRVALARALAVGPALVLLDEPFSSLDAGLRASVRQDLRRVLSEAGTTTVMVTHDQDEALSLSDKVAVMEDGCVGQCDTPIALYARPGSPALARGLGEANFISGTGRGYSVETPLGTLPLDAPLPAGGTALVVMVRPEQIKVGPVSGDGGATGVVIEREYYGHDALLRVRTEGLPGTALTVRVAKATALPELGARIGLLVSGAVVGWPVPSSAPTPTSAPAPKVRS